MQLMTDFSITLVAFGDILCIVHELTTRKMKLINRKKKCIIYSIRFFFAVAMNKFYCNMYYALAEKPDSNIKIR